MTRGAGPAHAGKGMYDMRRLMNRLLGLKTATGGDDDPADSRSASADSRVGPPSMEDSSDNGVRRQLVQVVLRDCLRSHGVPGSWIECQMMAVNSRSRGPGLYLRLVMREWDIRLLTYAFAFEQQFRANLLQFEPQAANWLHGISWELDVQASCPFPDMPDAAVWKTPAGPVPAAAAAASADGDTNPEILQDLQELQRMFAARDADLGQQASAGTAPVDFQNTEPSRIG